MTALYTTETNAFALAVIAIIFFNTKKHITRSRVERSLFLWLTTVLAFLLLADTAAWAVDKIPGGYFWNWASNAALFIISPAATALWALYADYQVAHEKKRLKKLAVPLATLVLINAAATIATLKTGWIFTVSFANIYSRGPFFELYAILCYLVLSYTFIFIAVNKKRINKRHFATLLLFPLPTAVGGLLQCMFYGLTLTWSGMSLSMLLIYFYIQDRRMDTDYLTGAYNRRLLDSFMKDLTQAASLKKAFSAILVDLDHFKRINDTLGHDAGDSALTDAVGLLKGCLRHGDFITRYGGDEFLILLDIGSKEVLEETVRRLKESFRRFNESRQRPYPLSFSAGYDIFDMGSGMDPEQFIRHVDALMYEDKKK